MTALSMGHKGQPLPESLQIQGTEQGKETQMIRTSGSGGGQGENWCQGSEDFSDNDLEVLKTHKTKTEKAKPGWLEQGVRLCQGCESFPKSEEKPGEGSRGRSDCIVHRSLHAEEAGHEGRRSPSTAAVLREVWWLGQGERGRWERRDKGEVTLLLGHLAGCRRKGTHQIFSDPTTEC